jgi:glucose-1-phosphate adenylyltransferase
MDYRPMLAAHDEANAALTVATFEVPIAQATQLGVLATDDESMVVEFAEKPESPKPAPGRTDVALSNMGVYVFDTETLVRSVVEDSRKDSAHDFGRNIIPTLVERGARVHGYRLRSRAGRKVAYWRDVGTLEAYYDAHMDLLENRPPITLRDSGWPLRTWQRQFPPTYVGDDGQDRADVRDSLVAAGVEIRGAVVRRSVLSPGVTIEPGAVVDGAILLDGVRVGAGARVQRAIVDKLVQIPPGFELGGDRERDSRMFSVSPGGLVAVEKLAVLD